MAEAPAPNMVDRLFLQLHAMGLPGQLYVVLIVDGALDVDALRAAFAETLAEDPVLSSRVERSAIGFRRVPGRWSASKLESQVIEAAWSEGELPLPEHPDLAECPPAQLVIDASEPERTRLCLAMHHSAGDAFGALLVLERLGAHYRHALRGEPVPPPPIETQPRGFRGLFASLERADQWTVIRRAGATLLGSARTGAYGTGTEACATFADVSLPATPGALRYAVQPIPWTLIGRLLRIAARQRASLTDALLAATVVTAAELWPDQRSLPVLASVPMALRTDRASDVANRALPNNIVIPWALTGDRVATLHAVRDQSSRSRGVVGGLVQATERSVLSALPPSLAARLIRGALASEVNQRESLTFTSLGSLEPVARDFAGCPVLDAYAFGSLLTPPGLKVAIVPSRSACNLVVHWNDGVTDPARATALGPAIQSRVAAWVKQAGADRQASKERV